MTFDKLTKPELADVADYFAVEISTGASKAEMIQSLIGCGVDWGYYQKNFPDAKGVEVKEPVNNLQKKTVATPVVSEGELILVRMTRGNPRYEVRGHTFTRDNPFALVNEEDADFLCSQRGFHIATPKEARGFYG